MILLTLSPSNALQLLNGKPVVLPFKVPLGTAYMYVAINSGILCENLDEPKIVYFKGARNIPLKVSLSPMNGLVVAKCEITACEPYLRFTDRKKVYAVDFSALTVFDKPMELKEFGITRAPSRWQHIELAPEWDALPSEPTEEDIDLYDKKQRVEVGK